MRGIEPRCNRSNQMRLYEEYYLKQTGHGMPAFTGARYQRGHGLGNILRSLTKLAVPFLKKGASRVGKQALKTGMDIAQDAMQGHNIKAAAKKRVSQGLKQLITQQGRGGPPGQRIKRRKKGNRVLKIGKRGYKRKASSSRRVISHSAKKRRTSTQDALS